METYRASCLCLPCTYPRMCICWKITLHFTWDTVHYKRLPNAIQYQLLAIQSLNTEFEVLQHISDVQKVIKNDESPNTLHGCMVQYVTSSTHYEGDPFFGYVSIPSLNIWCVCVCVFRLQTSGPLPACPWLRHNDPNSMCIRHHRFRDCREMFKCLLHYGWMFSLKGAFSYVWNHDYLIFFNCLEEYSVLPSGLCFGISLWT